MKNLSSISFFLLLVLSSVASSVTANLSKDGGNVNITLTYDPSNGHATLSGSITGAWTPATVTWAKAFWGVGYINSSGARVGLGGGDSGSSVNGTFPITNTSWFPATTDWRGNQKGLYLQAWIDTGKNGAVTTGTGVQMFDLVFDGTQYYVNVTLPGGGGMDRLYFAFQDGAVIGNYQVGATQMSRVIRLGPLATDHEVTLREVTGGNIDTDPDGNNPRPAADGSTEMGVAVGSTPTLGMPSGVGGSTLAAPAENTQTKMAKPTAPAAKASAATAAAAPSVPATITGGLTGSSSAATGSDIATSSNAVIAALDTVNKREQVNAAAVVTALNNGTNQVSKNGDAIVDAINQSIKATDSVKAAVEKKGTETGTGTGGTDMSGTNSRLDDVKTKLDKIIKQGEDGDAKVTTGQTDSDARAAAYGSAVSGKVASAKTSGEALAGGLGGTQMFSDAGSFASVNFIPIDDGYASEAHFLDTSGSKTMEGAFGGQVDLNPLTSEAMAHTMGIGTAQKAFTWIRNFISWALLVGFLIWTFHQVREYMFALSSVGQLQLPGSSQIVLHTSVAGTSVGVPGAVVLYGIQVAAITTLILAAPVIIIAGLDGAGGFHAAEQAVKSGQTGTGLGTFLAHAFSYANAIFPLLLALTCFGNRLLVQMQGIIQWAINIVILRVLAA